MAGPIRIAILANGAQARRELDQVSRSARTMGGIVGKAGRLAATGLAVGLGAAVFAGKKFAEAAAEDQTSAALLARQLRASTDARSKDISSTESWITTQGKVLGVTDEQLRPALSKLASATHDVGKAQDLVSLAMEVSAGRSLDLNTVSLALMKGYNGQTAGLSRLGVKTKDAAGKALSFKQITEDLADTFGGAAKTKAETLQGTIDRLKVRFSEAGEDLGRKFLPPLADLAERGLDGVDALSSLAKVNLVPKLQDLSKWYRKNSDDLADLARTGLREVVPAVEELAGVAGDLAGKLIDVSVPLAKQLLPRLGDLADLASNTSDALGDLPGPLKTIGGEAALAALIMPRLVSGVGAVSGAVTRTTGTVRTNIAALQQWRAELTYTETRAGAAATATGKLGTAAKGAAGVGGMLALADSTNRTNRGLGALEGAAGGALLGFSLGGPWGAAIGAGAGALVSLATNTDKASDSLDHAKKPAVDFASSLDQVTGAATRSTRQMVFQKLATDGVLTAAANLGLSSRDVVSAVLGQEDALKRVNGAIKNNSGTIATWTDQYGGTHQVLSQANADSNALASALGLTTGELNDQIKATRAQALATENLGKVFHGLPRQVITDFRAGNIPESRRDVARLAAQYKLTPHQIKTTLTAIGSEASVKSVQRLVAKLQEANKTKVAPDIKGGVQKATRDAEAAAGTGSAKIADTIDVHLRKTRATMPQLQPSLRTALGGAAATGHQGATGIGTSVKTGFGAGFAGAILSWSAQLRSAVNAAIAAGRAAAKAHSPSEETARLGRDLADGLVLGLAAKEGEARKHGKTLVQQILAGVKDGSEGVDKALSRLEKLVRDRITGKGDEKRENALLKSLHDQFAGLRANGGALDKINKKLQDQRDNLAALQQQATDYSAAIAQSFIDTGNLVNLGKDSNGQVSLQALLSQLTNKVQRAQQFTALIQQLAASGLSQTALQQLLDAGPDAALETAQAIAAGGTQAITQINTLTGQLAASGQELGTQMANQFYGAGIQAAAGLVAGLEDSKKDLEKIAEKLGQALVDAVKKKLGIKSPSTVFAELGAQSVRGLGIGLDEVYVRRQGERLAKAVVTGYGQPALTTFLGGAGVGQLQARSVHFTADEIDQLSRGRAIRRDLDAFERVGGAAHA